jgi:hypothetical protein
MAGGAIDPEKTATSEILDRPRYRGSIPRTAAVDFADNNYTKQLKAAPILDKQANKQPNHPDLAHYLTRSYDFAPAATCV